MEMERNEKVLAIYRAVWKLIDEGNDISRVKVADITAKAGIGKEQRMNISAVRRKLLQRPFDMIF